MDDAVPDGFEPLDLGAGYSLAFGPVYRDRATARLGFRVTQAHVNPVGTLHGGAIATFADMQCVAVRPGMDEGAAHTPTINLSVDFIAPARIGDWVEAAVTHVRSTRSMLFTQAIVSTGGRAIARSTAIYRIYDTAGE